jgi:hypothetical protein
MKLRTIVVGLPVAFFTLSLLTTKTDAVSDWIGVYARIDKVVLEPNAKAPERIQIWGAFALASKKDRNSYEPAQRGYLYYSVAQGKEEVCRKEWADLKASAGTGNIIGFGGRDLQRVRLRKREDKPADPDPYAVGWGLVKMSDRRSNYPPVVELKSLPPEKN